MTFEDFLQGLATHAASDCEGCPLNERDVEDICERIDNGDTNHVPCVAAEMVLTAQRGLRDVYERAQEGER